MADRQLDLVLYGATGFTGSLVAEYLAKHQPEGFRWALAGRSASKLEAVRQRLAAQDAALADLQAELRDHPDVPEDLMRLDLSRPSEPTFSVRLARGDLTVSFFGTVTVFSAPQNVTAEELRIESYFPLDEGTREVFLAAAR